MKNETTFIFVNTFPRPYYEKIIANAMRNFAVMVWSEELIEHGIKNKKLDVLKSPIETELVEENGETEVVFSN